MSPAVHGDERLAARLGELLGPRHPAAGAAVVSPRGTVLAAQGAGPGGDFEIGSVSKGVTGLLYADALARGEVAPETTLGELLPLGNAPAANVTLRSLSTHRSGLPRLPASARPWRRTLALWRHGTNPYGETLTHLLHQARGVPLGKPRPRYSNLGFALLGHALARAAGTTYAQLLQHRLATPLGLDCLYAPATAARLRPGALPGRSRGGWRPGCG
ncbi:serine hydrolase domain-containing protein [Streptomyces albidoflavus]|uniref:serine hydrolase domain-containing protein n=1 Tax=Streptomyces albidoflavus TaxID=1886 RepID=UPI0033B241C3